MSRNPPPKSAASLSSTLRTLPTSSHPICSLGNLDGSSLTKKSPSLKKTDREDDAPPQKPALTPARSRSYPQDVLGGPMAWIAENFHGDMIATINTPSDRKGKGSRNKAESESEEEKMNSTGQRSNNKTARNKAGGTTKDVIAVTTALSHNQQSNTEYDEIEDDGMTMDEEVDEDLSRKRGSQEKGGGGTRVSSTNSVVNKRSLSASSSRTAASPAGSDGESAPNNRSNNAAQLEVLQRMRRERMVASASGALATSSTVVGAPTSAASGSKTNSCSYSDDYAAMLKRLKSLRDT